VPGIVEDAGSHSWGYWGVSLACLFEGSAENEGQRFHALEGWWGLFINEAAGGGGWRLVGQVDGSIGGHCLVVAGAVGVFAGEGSGEGMFVSDMAAERRVQAVGFLVWEAMQDKDGELMGGVRVQAKK